VNSLPIQATYYTKSVAVAVLAVVISFLINRAGQKYIGTVTNSVVSPVVEETLKTSFSIIVGASVLATHLGFGLLEAAIEGGRSRLAALLAVLTHVIFGAVTVVLGRYLGIYAGISASVLLHMLWNSYIYDLVSLQRKE